MFKSVFKSGIRGIYDVLNNPSFVSEPWYIYPAKHKTSGKLASVFIFDKSKFESTIVKLCSSMSNTKNPKVIISECYELIKHEVNQLSKLKHPQILTVFEILEETKLKFLFASELVTDNLLTIDFDNKLDELSIQKGLLEICKGVQFLHNYGSIIHMNLQPSSIFINQQGDWKLAGFRFIQNLNEISPSERENFFIMNNTSIVPFVNQNLNFMAPELVIDNLSKLDFSNDIWSLGCLIFFIYNKGKYLIECFDLSNISDFKTEFRKFESKFYNHRVSDLKYVLKDVPPKLYSIFPSILARRPNDRLTIDQVIDLDYFNSGLVKAMWFVDEFSTKSLEDRLVFLRGLLEVIDGKLFLDQFPQNFKTNKLVPLLIEFLRGELSINLAKDELTSTRIDSVCYAFEITLRIGSTLSNLSFHDRIFDHLFVIEKKKKNKTDYFDKLINFSVKVRLTLIMNLETLIEKLNDKDLVDLLKKSSSLMLTFPSNEAHYKAEQVQTQDLFLKKTDLFIGKFDFPYIKNTFFPLICQVFKTTTILSTKLATIKVFEDVVDGSVIDKLIVIEQILPIFQNLKSRDKRIVSTVLSFFLKLSQNDHILLDLETIVESILPICLKLVFGCQECTQAEFKGYMKKIQEIQDYLSRRKLTDLPTKLPDKPVPGNESVATFNSLISSQPINNNTMDKKLTTPQGQVMKPARTSSETGSRINPTSRPSAASSLNSPILQPKRSSTESPVLQPRRNPQPLKLKTEPRVKPNLSFGATSNEVPSRLLNTLEGTFSGNEFLDFQSATPVATPPTTTPPVFNSMSRTTSGSTTPSISTPPGFNGSILTPSHKPSKPASYSNSMNNNNPPNGDSLDLI